MVEVKIFNLNFVKIVLQMVFDDLFQLFFFLNLRFKIFREKSVLGKYGGGRYSLNKF